MLILSSIEASNKESEYTWVHKNFSIYVFFEREISKYPLEPEALEAALPDFVKIEKRTEREVEINNLLL